MTIEFDISSQYQVQTMKTEKAHDYDLLASEFSQMYICEVVVIPYVMTWSEMK
ncbi:hypothetical protein PAEPH01_1639 [Pancytospora epiphaga]|nr:hypothetical protein PAEPH01_1639 [Pancytospora epiphaga]